MLRFAERAFLFCCLVVFAASAALAGDRARAATDQPFLLVEDPWPPYTLGESGRAPHGGLMVELMGELFKRIGQPLRLELHPWKRCIFMVQKQKADGLMLTVKTPEREEYAYFPEHFFINQIQFFHRSDSDFTWNDFSDLKGLTIGLVAGAKYSKEFQDAIKELDLTVEEVTSIGINFRKLKAGRIDITPVLNVVAASIIQGDSELTGHIHAAPKPLRVTAMQMAIGRSSRLMEFAGAIDDTIKEMKMDGTVDRIYGRHVVVIPVH